MDSLVLRMAQPLLQSHARGQPVRGFFRLAPAALTDAVQMADLIWRGIAVWDKTSSCRPQRGRPRNQAEYIVWGSKGPMPLSRRAPTIEGVHREYQSRGDKHHSTGKPVGVMRWLCSLCEPNGLILDPFAGSGTTGVAAVLDGYRFIGVERDPRYFAVAERRLQAASSGEILASLNDRAVGEAARSLMQRRRSAPRTSQRTGAARRKSAL